MDFASPLGAIRIGGKDESTLFSCQRHRELTLIRREAAMRGWRTRRTKISDRLRRELLAAF